jgi:plastocyanin
MTRLLTFLIGGALMLSFLAVESAHGQKKEAAGKKHEVLMLDNSYKPAKITIEAGDTIVWVNKGKKTHTATSADKVPKDLEFDTDDVEPGKSAKPITFAKAGEIPYVCIHHRDMKGTVIVKAKGKGKEK